MLWLKAIWNGIKSAALVCLVPIAVFAIVVAVSGVIGVAFLGIDHLMSGVFGVGWWRIPMIVFLIILSAIMIAYIITEIADWIKREHARLEKEEKV